MQYRVEIALDLDPDANFLDSDPRWHSESLRDLIVDMLYDVDDIEDVVVKVEEV